MTDSSTRMTSWPAACGTCISSMFMLRQNHSLVPSIEQLFFGTSFSNKGTFLLHPISQSLPLNLISKRVLSFGSDLTLALSSACSFSFALHAFSLLPVLHQFPAGRDHLNSVDEM